MPVFQEHRCVSRSGPVAVDLASLQYDPLVGRLAARLRDGRLRSPGAPGRGDTRYAFFSILLFTVLLTVPCFTKVTNLAPLSKLTKLKRLWLSRTPVTNLTPLSKLTNLKRLRLIDTRVGKSQVAALKKALPGLQVIR